MCSQAIFGSTLLFPSNAVLMWLPLEHQAFLYTKSRHDLTTARGSFEGGIGLYSDQIRWSGKNTGFLVRVNEAGPFWLHGPTCNRLQWKKLLNFFTAAGRVTLQQSVMYSDRPPPIDWGKNRGHNLTSHNGSCYVNEMTPDSPAACRRTTWFGLNTALTRKAEADGKVLQVFNHKSTVQNVIGWWSENTSQGIREVLIRLYGNTNVPNSITTIPLNDEVSTCRWSHKRRVSRYHSLGLKNVCPTFHANRSSSWSDISIWAKRWSDWQMSFFANLTGRRNHASMWPQGIGAGAECRQLANLSEIWLIQGSNLGPFSAVKSFRQRHLSLSRQN